MYHPAGLKPQRRRGRSFAERQRGLRKPALGWTPSRPRGLRDPVNAVGEFAPAVLVRAPHQWTGGSHASEGAQCSSPRRSLAKARTVLRRKVAHVKESVALPAAKRLPAARRHDRCALPRTGALACRAPKALLRHNARRWPVCPFNPQRAMSAPALEAARSRSDTTPAPFQSSRWFPSSTQA